MLDNYIPTVSTVLLGGAVFLIIVRLLKNRDDPKWNLPPGPGGWPLYGNMLVLKKRDVCGPGALDDWASKYGEIYSLQLGSYRAVILNSANIIKEAFVKHSAQTNGRSSNVFFFKLITAGNFGVVFSEGENWKQTRRTTLHSLRDFGMGKSSLEEKVQEEASALVDLVEKQGNQPFSPKMIFHNAVSNVICSVIFGERYDYDDDEFRQFSKNLDILFSGGGFKNPEIFIPALTLLIPLLNWSLFKAARANEDIKKYIRMKVKSLRKQFDPDDIKCFADIYFKADMDGEFNNIDAELNLLVVIQDLFIAGSETTTTTLRWILLYMINYPDVQVKCQQEIAKVIGQVQAPSIKHRQQLPFVEATLNEIQRMASVVAYGVIHRAVETFELTGFTIPKDTLIISNLHYIHHDPKQWEEPEEFQPDRWLDNHGKVIKHDSFLPFAVGACDCIGKNLALNEIFIMFVALLQKFTFRCEPGKNTPKIEGSMGIVHAPHDYKIVAEKL